METPALKVRYNINLIYLCGALWPGIFIKIIFFTDENSHNLHYVMHFASKKYVYPFVIFGKIPPKILVIPSTADRCQLPTDVNCQQMSTADRCQLPTDVNCRQVSTADRCQLLTGVNC